MMGSKDARQIVRSVAIDREAEGRDPLELCLVDGLSRILNAVTPLILIAIVRLSIREEEQQPMRGRLPHQSGRGVTDRRPNARVLLGLKGADPKRDLPPIRFFKAFDLTDDHRIGPFTRKGEYGPRLAHPIECHADQEERLALDIDDAAMGSNPCIGRSADVDEKGDGEITLGDAARLIERFGQRSPRAEIRISLHVSGKIDLITIEEPPPRHARGAEHLKTPPNRMEKAAMFFEGGVNPLLRT